MERINAGSPEEASRPSTAIWNRPVEDVTTSLPADGTSFMVSSLVRRSLAGASTLRQRNRGTYCARCHQIHRGTCSDLAALAQRPKSVLVTSPRLEGNDWISLNSSRRATVDSSNLWTGFDVTSDQQEPSTATMIERQVVPSLEEEKERARHELEYSKNVDGGYAWVILAVTFIINATVFGAQPTYALIYDKLVDEKGLNQPGFKAIVPFAAMQSLEHLMAPVCGCILALTGSWRLTIVSGCFLVAMGHQLAGLWWDSQIGQWLTLGLMGGTGTSFILISFFQINHTYFHRYHNRAEGIVSAGKALGTLAIEPLCRFFLVEEFKSTRMCYMALSLVMAPNVLLAFLLRPLEPPAHMTEVAHHATPLDAAVDTKKQQQVEGDCHVHINNTSHGMDHSHGDRNHSPWLWFKQVVMNPYFHLIWPTEFLYSCLKLVLSIVIVNFLKDRMDEDYKSYLISCWALGELFSSLVLSSLLDFKLLTTRYFTVVCFFAIGITIHMLKISKDHWFDLDEDFGNITMLALVFVLSMLIALLNMLVHCLIGDYVEDTLQAGSLGMTVFTGGLFLQSAAKAISSYTDEDGADDYDEMFRTISLICLGAGLVWLILPTVGNYLCISIRSKNKQTSNQVDGVVMRGETR